MTAARYSLHRITRRGAHVSTWRSTLTAQEVEAFVRGCQRRGEDATVYAETGERLAIGGCERPSSAEPRVWWYDAEALDDPATEVAP